MGNKAISCGVNESLMGMPCPQKGTEVEVGWKGYWKPIRGWTGSCPESASSEDVLWVSEYMST